MVKEIIVGLESVWLVLDVTVTGIIVDPPPILLHDARMHSQGIPVGN